MRLRVFAIGTAMALGLAVGYATEKATVGPSPPIQGKAGEPMSVEETEIIAPKHPANWGLPIHGGIDRVQARPLEFNRAYRLDHDQQLDQLDYFYVDLAPGLKMTLALRTFDEGTEDSDPPTAGIQLQNKDGAVIHDLQIKDLAGILRTGLYRPAKKARFYVAVGSTSGLMKEQSALFKVSVIPYSMVDAPEQRDAGGQPSNASPIGKFSYEKNHLGGTDTIDMFALDVLAGERYKVQIKLAEPAPALLKIRILDNDGNELSEAVLDGVTEMESAVFEAPKSGKCFIAFSLKEPSDQVYPYDFKVIFESSVKQRVQEKMQQR